MQATFGGSVSALANSQAYPLAVADPLEACTPLTNASALKGAIVLVQRGTWAGGWLGAWLLCCAADGSTGAVGAGAVGAHCGQRFLLLCANHLTRVCATLPPTQARASSARRPWRRKRRARRAC